MRDPSQIGNTNRERWLQTTLAGLKKLRGEKSNKKPSGKKLDKSTIARVDKAPEPKAQEQTKPGTEKAPSNPDAGTKTLDLGVVDFTTATTVRDVQDTPKFQRKFHKQLHSTLPSVSRRQTAIDRFIDAAGHSGKLSQRRATKVIRALKKEGLITNSQAHKMTNKLGI